VTADIRVLLCDDHEMVRAANLLRTELVAAVRARTAVPVVGCDLSGGLDSTPLCFLAAKTAPRLVALTMAAVDPAHDDRVWAAEAAAELPGVQRLMLGLDSLPDMYTAVDQPAGPLDEPLLWTRTRERNLHIGRQYAAAGATVRITGHGGDEVLHAPPTYLHTLARSGSKTRLLRRARIAAAVQRWSLGRTLRTLGDSRTYSAWLADSARSLTEPLDISAPSTQLGWSYPLRMPPWATAEAVDAARTALLAYARNAEPDGATRDGHTTLHGIRLSGCSLRLLNQLTPGGPRIEAPYVDDRVLEVCMAVDAQERNRTGSYKPLVVEAMRDLLPAASLRRATKGEFSADVHTGRRTQRAALGALFEDSRLAGRGLVDGPALRRTATGLYPPTLTPFALDPTLALERWLRDLPDQGLQPSGRPIAHAAQ
jgi:asparagine synthase (glutamine-hydrolysing)